jgi:hypothetical protein
MSRRRSNLRSRRLGGGGEVGKYVVGGFLIALSLSLVGAGAFFYATAETRPVLDRATLCPTDGYHSATIILLDASDTLPEVTRRELKTYLVDAAESVPEYGMVEIRLLDPNSPSGSSVFAKCNPGNGTGIDELTGNPELARRRWLESFRKPLELALDGAMNPSASETSPLMSTIQSIAVDRFSGKRAASLPKSLIVVSDLIEHGPGYSQYSGNFSFDSFRKTDIYRRVRTDLQGADVTLRYIQRVTRKPINSAEHIQFWTDWIKDSNGHFVSAKKLQGAG